MGIHDREYYREEQQGGVRWQLGSPAQSAAMQLVAAIVLVYIVCVLAGEQVTGFLSLQAESLYKPWMWWQLISYSFVHDTNWAWHLVGNLLGLWFFGTEVESVFGRRTFLRLYFGAVILGAMVWVARLYFLGSPDVEFLTRYTLLGASGGVTAVIILFCLKFPTRIIYLMFVLPAPAWLLGLIIVAGDLLLGRGSSEGIAFDVHLVGAVLGFLYFQFGDLLGWTDGAVRTRRVRTSARSTGSTGGGWFGWLKPKPKLKIHQPTTDEPIDPEVDYDELDERGDEVLAKMHREGEESLTEEERKILAAYSRRMQQKLR